MTLHEGTPFMKRSAGAADKVRSPENREQAAVLPRRQANDFDLKISRSQAKRD